MLFVAENTSPALHKVSEIYDRIGFAAVGKYNEFENLRVAGIRLADLRGYSYDRRDVTARALANAYAQTLGAIFTEQQKPYEVELCVAEVGASAGSGPALPAVLRRHHRRRAELPGDGRPGRRGGRPGAGGLPAEPAAGRGDGGRGARRSARSAARTARTATLSADSLEVAVLDRNRGNRKFRRILGPALTSLLPGNGSAVNSADAPADTPPTDTQPTDTPPTDTPRPAGTPPAGENGGEQPAGEPGQRPGNQPAGPAAEGTGAERLPDTD